MQASTGITLTAINTVKITEFAWTPALMVQTEEEFIEQEKMQHLLILNMEHQMTKLLKDQKKKIY